MPRKNHTHSRKIFLKTARKVDPQEYISWLVLLTEVKKRLDHLFYKSFKTPTILIVGSQDHAFLKDDILFCKLNPETILHIIPLCGHLSNIDQYKEFNRLALNFLMKQKSKVPVFMNDDAHQNNKTRNTEYAWEH